MILKIPSLGLFNADNLYKKQKIEDRPMMPLEPELHDYYGYNSIINQDGRRVRRMRRTEASVEKLQHSKVRSPNFSRSASSRRSKIERQEGNNCSASLNQTSSNFKIGQVNSVTKQEKQNQSCYSVRNYNANNSNLMQSQESKTVHVKDVKSAMGQYYLCNTVRQLSKSAKKLSIKKVESTDRGNKKLRGQQAIENNFNYLSASPSPKRTLKKTEKSQQITSPFQFQETDGKNQENNEYIPDIQLLKKRESNLRLKISINNPKSSMMSIKSHDSSQISRSRISNNEANVKSGILKKNHVYFESNLLTSQNKVNKEIDKNVDPENQKKSNLKRKTQNKSSIHNQLASEISDFSQKSSKQSTYAEKIRSKIKSREQKSKISVIHKRENEREEVQIRTNQTKNTKLAKKSTETTQSNQSHQNSRELKRPNHQLTIQMTPKIAKKSSESETDKFKAISITNEPKRTEFKANPQRSKQIQKVDSSIMNETSSLKPSSISRQSMIQQRQSIKNQVSLPSPKLGQLQQNLKITKKKSLSSYTFNDVVQNIEQHEIRLQSINYFVDSTKNLYESPLKFERYERLCFLMLRKYALEKQRIVKSLKGGENCFILTNAQIPIDVLKKHMNRLEVRERLNMFIEESNRIKNELQTQYNNKMRKKYPNDKYIKSELMRDNFSPQIMRLLMQQLTKLYQQLQAEQIQNQMIDANEQRVIQIIQIMFLMSELSGRPVKAFELFEQSLGDFQYYYSLNYERIMQTAEYFEKYA